MNRVEHKQADPDQPAINTTIDAPMKAGVQVRVSSGIAQQIGAETAFRACTPALDSEAGSFPRSATDGPKVISF
ncbi:hypothetical protein [Aestuariivirga sp.]|uniref:hypothetical protein n=1 Tax=Aestuariivirga sp. TaxID=2650926 RepID=UPI00391C5378